MVLLNYISIDNLLHKGLDETEHAFCFVPADQVLSYWLYLTKGVITCLPIAFIFIPEKGQVNRGVVFGLLIITALLAFEILNFSNTVFVFKDLLGDLRFWGVR